MRDLLALMVFPLAIAVTYCVRRIAQLKRIADDAKADAAAAREEKRLAYRAEWSMSVDLMIAKQKIESWRLLAEKNRANWDPHA